MHVRDLKQTIIRIFSELNYFSSPPPSIVVICPRITSQNEAFALADNLKFKTHNANVFQIYNMCLFEIFRNIIILKIK